MSRILVTGATGFVGSHLVRALVQRGDDVHCLVRHTSDVTPLEGLGVTLHIGDLLDRASLDAAVAGAEYIYHCAAALLVTSQEAFDAVNYRGTLNLLDATRQHAGPGLKRFLYVSSQAAAGPSRDTSPKTEADPPAPISWYGASKFKAEQAVLEFAQTHPATIVRPSSVYGERERDVSQVFPLVEHRIQPVLGLQKKYVVMIYVQDLVDGMIKAAENPNSLGQIYFLNHPEPLTTRQVIRTVAAAADRRLGLPLPVPTQLFGLAAPFAELMHELTRDRPTTTRDKAREISQRFWIADPTRAQQQLGWIPAHDLSAGMRRTLASYRADQQALRSMALDLPGVLWLKFILTGMVIGTIIETTSFLNHFYSFDPWWLVFVVALGGFGVLLGTLAWMLRRRSDAVQFVLPTVIVGLAEAANVAWLHAWTFRAGWPFGINDPYVRAALLGTAGGFVVLIINAVQRRVYEKRLREA